MKKTLCCASAVLAAIMFIVIWTSVLSSNNRQSDSSDGLIAWNEVREETALPESQELTPTLPTDSGSLASDNNEDTVVEQPTELLQILSDAGKELTNITASQLIVVAVEDSTVLVYAFEKDLAGQWSQCLEAVTGHIGKNGITDKKEEGDLKTPSGLFSLPFAFGIKDDPGCTIEYRQISEDSYWIDDSASAYYNQWVEGTENQDWSSAEHLISYPNAYAYAVAIGYNVNPIVPGLGSAIFLHCGNKATAGCVSVSEETMLWIFRWLKPEATPQILIAQR